MSTLKNNKEQYAKYLSGKMSPEEAHTFEREVLNDPFEQEALEGLERLASRDVLSDIEKLQASVSKKQNKGSGWMKIAAAAALLIVSSLTVWMISNPITDSQELAMEKKEVVSEEESTEAEMADADATPIEEKKPVPENSSIAAETKEQNIPVPNPTVARAEPEEIEVETEMAPDLQIASAEPLDVDVVLQEVISEEVSGDDVIVEALQGKSSGLQIAEQEFFSSDSIEEVDLSNALVAKEAEVIKSDTRRAKRAPAGTGAAARSAAFAPPSKNVSGKITDESGEGLPGVNIIEKGTTNGVVSDLDGNYQLEISTDATLVISFVGFETNEIEVGDRETVDVSLGGLTELQEVVVTGYGVADRTSSFKAAGPESGNKSYKNYLEENLIYPEAATNSNIEGTVVLELTLSSSGQISKIDIKKSLGYGCDQEAVRLVREGPKWNPAERDGNTAEDKARVRVRFKIVKN